MKKYTKKQMELVERLNETADNEQININIAKSLFYKYNLRKRRIL